MAQKYDLTRVHQANLTILKEIDRICRKHGINYALDAGTLLGAVRHKGFIPWDDDADIAFTRPNYEAFVKVASAELAEGLTLLKPDERRGGKAFYDFTARIIYDRSRTHEDTEEMKFYEGRLNHLWVDLFVIDELPENTAAAAWTKLLHTIVYGFAMGHRHCLDYGKYGLAGRVCVWLLAGIGRRIPMKTIFGMQRRVALKDRKGRSRLRYYSNYQPDFLYVTLKREWCEKFVDLEFEDTKLMAPRGWREVLRCIYGDYEKLPPAKDRVPAHSSMEIQILD